MTADPAAALVRMLAERGQAPFLHMPGFDVSGAEMSTWIGAIQDQLEARAADLTPGATLGIRGLDPRARIAAPLAAWSLGYSTYFVSEREPDSHLHTLLEEAGCALYIEDVDDDGLVWTAAPGRLTFEDGPHTLLRTSGSSGTPKLAIHGLAQHLESARAAARHFALGPSHRWLLTLPTWHVGGLGIVFRALVSGASLAVPAFDAPLERALTELQPTHLSLVSTQLVRLLRMEETRAGLQAATAILLGGGPLPASLRAEILDRELPVHVSYGATETSALIAVSGDPEVLGRPDAAGYVLPGRRVRVDDAGRIDVAGPTVFRGYLEDGVLMDARDAEGWYATGDLGRIEDDGLLLVRGRADRMFISGGENIQPEEIEAALLDLEAVRAAAVVSRPDDEFGHRPVAFVTLAPGTSTAGVEAALRERLPGYKVPDAFLPLPKPVAGQLKVDLKALEARAREDLPDA